MKKVLLVIAAAAFFVATPSCKKGENDPFLSLKSRKARLAGEYDIASWITSLNATNSDGDAATLTTTINGSTGTTVMTSTPDGEPTTTTTRAIVVNSASFTIGKDGTWSSVMNTTTSWTDEGDGWIVDNYSYTAVETSSESGNWGFIGGQADEFKNKERILMSTLMSNTTSQTTSVTNYEDGSNDTDTGSLYNSTDTYAQGAMSVVYEIDMLKSKEITLVQDNGDRQDNATTTGAITYNYSVTTTGNTEISLTAK
jgi:hypothetical protein